LARAILASAGIAACLWPQWGFSAEPISPLPLTLELDEHKVQLGEKLFHDPRLSKSGTIACVSCHAVSRSGDDGLPRSITNNGEPDLTNAPTVFNAGFNFRQTWRGEFRTLEEQAEADLKNPRHTNTSWEELLPKLRNDTHYSTLFSAAYGSVSREGVLDALATYERSLITPNARIDQYLRGKADALSTEEIRGYRLFKEYGCVACHQGINIGGNLYQKMGVAAPFFTRARKLTNADLGLFTVTRNEVDKNVFKVPSLRNVAVTAPYFHDGSAPSLEAAVDTMAKVQLGVHLPTEHRRAIVAFLKTLTGEYRGRRLDAATSTKP
jgi:cytochrome c peroxidase